MSQVILQTSLLDGYLIPYTSYGRFNLRFGCSIHVSKCILGFWFFKADLLLQVHFFVLAANFAFKGILREGKMRLTAAQGVAQHSRHPELGSTGGSVKLSCKSLFRDRKNGPAVFSG